MKIKKYIILIVIVLFILMFNFSYGAIGESFENKKYYMTMAEYKSQKFPGYIPKEGIDFLKSDMYPNGIVYHKWIVGKNIEGFQNKKFYLKQTKRL